MDSVFKVQVYARCASAVILLFILPVIVRGDVSLNNMFGDHMVFQQGIHNRVCGKADAGEAVTVGFAGQSHQSTADAGGRWEVLLDPVA